MHELPVIESVLSIVLEQAKKHEVKKVLSVSLVVGELSDLVDEWMQRYFDYLTKETVAEGAFLKIEGAPIIVRCRTCDEEREVEREALNRGVCQACGSEDLALISGRQYFVKDMEAL